MPTNKVMLGAAIGALSTIIVWAVHQFAKVEIPTEIGIAGQTVLVFIAQYLIPNTPEQIATLQRNSDESIEVRKQKLSAELEKLSEPPVVKP